MTSAGPFLFSPISELYGRQVAYLTSQTSFIFFCLGAAFSQKYVTRRVQDMEALADDGA